MAAYGFHDAAMRSASLLWLLASSGLMTAMPRDASSSRSCCRMQAPINAFQNTTSEAAARRINEFGPPESQIDARHEVEFLPPSGSVR